MSDARCCWCGGFLDSEDLSWVLEERDDVVPCVCGFFDNSPAYEEANTEAREDTP